MVRHRKMRCALHVPSGCERQNPVFPLDSGRKLGVTCFRNSGAFSEPGCHLLELGVTYIDTDLPSAALRRWLQELIWRRSAIAGLLIGVSAALF